MKGTNTTITPQRLDLFVKHLPADALPRLLVTIVRECVKKKAYGKHKICDIVKEIEEATLRGGPRV